IADPASFGGLGANSLHIDAPNVERVPGYTSLLVLRADPAGGGASLLGDLRAALARFADSDRAELRRPVYFEGRAKGLQGVGRARLPFPVLRTPMMDGGFGGRARCSTTTATLGTSPCCGASPPRCQPRHRQSC